MSQILPLRATTNKAILASNGCFTDADLRPQRLQKSKHPAAHALQVACLRQGLHLFSTNVHQNKHQAMLQDFA